MGFEPMIRVLQTLALPLGHVAGSESLSGRWDSNPRPSPWQGDVLPTEPRPLVKPLGVLPGEPHSSRNKKPRQPFSPFHAGLHHNQSVSPHRLKFIGGTADHLVLRRHGWSGETGFGDTRWNRYAEKNPVLVLDIKRRSGGSCHNNEYLRHIQRVGES